MRRATRLGLALLGCAACQVPPTRHSHTEYRLPSPADVASVTWGVRRFACERGGEPVAPRFDRLTIDHVPGGVSLRFASSAAGAWTVQALAVRPGTALGGDYVLRSRSGGPALLRAPQLGSIQRQGQALRIAGLEEPRCPGGRALAELEPLAPRS